MVQIDPSPSQAYLRLGDIQIPELLYDEKLVSLAPNWSISPSTSYTGTIYTYTMPMWGSLAASIEVTGNWSQNQRMTATLASSTPAPSAGAPIVVTEYAASTARTTSKLLYLWTGLPINQVVTVALTVVADNGPTVLVTRVVGALRATRE